MAQENWRGFLLPKAIIREVNFFGFRSFLLRSNIGKAAGLLRLQSLLPNLEEERKKVGRIASEKRWRRRMKLTPCIVSTFFMLPSFGYLVKCHSSSRSRTFALQ